MKKTISINICGIIFNLDDDAYEVLKEYLQKLNLHFANSDEGREVIQDIEARIAELFQQKLSESKQVINLEDVNEVIELMGSPSDFAEELEDEEEKPSAKRRKKLYRDPDRRLIGGVCAGIAAYFDADLTLIRIIAFLLLLISSPLIIIAYIIMWILVPEAKTTAQKLEMRGEKVTVSNIEKSIRDEFENVKDSYDKFKKSKSAQKARDFGSQFINFLAEILRLGVRIILILLGIILVLTGIFSILAFFGVFFFKFSLFPFFIFQDAPFVLPDFFGFFASPPSVSLFSLGMILFIIIPLVVIAYAGLKLLINFKTNDRLFLITALFAWIFGILIIVGSVLFEGTNYSVKESFREKYEILSSSSTLYIDANTISFDDKNATILEDGFILFKDDKSEDKLFIRPEIDIVKGYSEHIEFIIIKSARGKTRGDAKTNAEKMEYSWMQKDSTLLIDSYYSIDEDAKWRASKLKMILKVPVGKQIHISDEMEEIIDDFENVDHLWEFEIGEHRYEMLPEGLKKIL